MLNLHNYKRTDGGYEGPTGLMEGTLSPPPVYENNLGNGSNKRRRFHPKREMLSLKAQLLSKAI